MAFILKPPTLVLVIVAKGRFHSPSRFIGLVLRPFSSEL